MTRDFVHPDTGVPEVVRSLTPKQGRWAELRAQGLSLAKCTRLAGYQCSSAVNFKNLGFALSRTPAVATAVVAFQRELLKSSAPRAIKVIEDLAFGDATPAPIKLKAALALADRGQIAAVQEISVSHEHTVTSRAPTLADLYREAGLTPPAQLTLPTGNVIEGEFEPVVEAFPVDEEGW